MSKLSLQDWTFGEIVRYDNGVMKGEGIVMGISTVPMATIGASVIIKDMSGNLPTNEYPYACFVCFENQLTR